MNPSDLTGTGSASDEADAGRDEDRYLVAHAAGQRIAVALRDAREILTVRAVTRLPGAPSWIAGLVNVRGAVVTVLDVGQRLGGAVCAGPVIVVDVAERKFGLRVDRVDGVARAAAAVESADAARSAGGAVRGVVTVSDAPALALDLEALQRAAIADA